MSLTVARTVESLRRHVSAWRDAGQRLALAPTMGALHEGHLSLVRQGRAEADRVIASVFVNPTQFGPAEDLGRYPRQEARDAELLEAEGCDLLYAPSVEQIYPPGFSTQVSVSGLSEGLEGVFRPVMFAGVATVVAKLLTQSQADVALFGEKDFQQLLIIRRMVRDLDLSTRVVAGATVREPDGLAMSSRNAYLEPGQRQTAAELYKVLCNAASRARAGEFAARIEADCSAALISAGFRAVDYVALRHAQTLEPFTGAVDAPARALAAARLGQTRLIDNVAV